MEQEIALTFEQKAYTKLRIRRSLLDKLKIKALLHNCSPSDYIELLHTYFGDKILTESEKKSCSI